MKQRLQLGLHAALPGRPLLPVTLRAGQRRQDAGRRRASTVCSGDDSTATASSSTAPISDRRQAYFFLDGIFPIRLGSWDPRYLLAQVEKEQLLERIKTHLPRDTGHGLRVEAVEAREKDGGAFVRCSYIPDTLPSALAAADGSAPDTALADIEKQVVEHYDGLSERPWYTWRSSRAHLVRGKPWREDLLNRFPSSTLRLEYESGPDLSQEQIYELCRPYGRIRDLEPQPKFANVTFTSIRSASAARNCLYGLSVKPNNAVVATRLRILYKERIKGHAFREWIANHPRIVIPIVAVLAGSVSYAVFDPIRSFFVKSHVSGLFDVEAYRLTKWLKKETIGRLGISGSDLLAGLGLGSGGRKGAGGDELAVQGTGIERERREAAERLSTWLYELPDTFITVTGPPGSGKAALVASVTYGAKNVLTVDCRDIMKEGRGSDSKLVSALATQLGYFPQFQWASSFNNLIDIASVGLIGTKAGFSTNLDVQIKQILDVAASALKALSDDAKTARDQAADLERQRIDLFNNETVFVANVQSGYVHDGRLDCLAANGVMGELGMGLEKSDHYSEIYGPSSFAKAEQAALATHPGTLTGRDGRSSTADIDEIPIVIVKGFDTGASNVKNADVLWTGLADWAAALVENRIAHVVFVNDNVAVSKNLARALPSKPFSSISLTDATSENAMQYVQRKLADYGKEELVQEANQAAIGRLGGRLTDLETLIQKMRGGATADEAVEDIISRSSTEIIKNCFGDDQEEAKSMPWTREQVWFLVKKLSKVKELSYAELLTAGPFKDQEKALRALEQAEIVSIVHRDGHPALLRPGKPSYRSAFAVLADNVVFGAQNELALNSKATAAASAAIKSAQEDLIALSQLFHDGKWTFGGTHTIPVEIAARVDECLQKMHKGQADLERLGKEAKELQEKLKSGGS